MALFVMITAAGISQETSWLLTLECEWEATFFGHRISRQPVRLVTPLSLDDETAIRWYLDEFSCTSPFQLGKAKEASQRIASFAQLVSSLFIKHNSTLQRALHRAPSIFIEPRFSSSNSSLAGFPWEALEDVDNWHGAIRPGTPICVVRSTLGLDPHDGPSMPRTICPSAFRCRNVLLISSRSLDSRDILPDLLTLPLVGLVESLPVDRRPRLHFARPATWSNVCALIKAHEPGFFDIVHFDVHGVYVEGEVKSEGKMCLQLSPPQVKDSKSDVDSDSKPKGPQGLINFQEISKTLGKAQVKLVVANACRSASLDRGWQNNLAATLVSAGVPYAIAMSYNISADGARIFTQMFYYAILSSRDPWNAARLGRTSMRANGDRHARFGQVVKVQDWMVPVLYAATSLDFSVVTSNQSRKHASMSGITTAEPGDDYPRGRAYDISRIEDLAFGKAAPHSGCKVLLIHGTGGIGKSLLLRYLSWWWEITRGFSRTFYLDFAERLWTTNDLEILIHSSTLQSRPNNAELPTRHNYHNGGAGEGGLSGWLHRLSIHSGSANTRVAAQDKTRAERTRPEDEAGYVSTAIILDNLDAVAAHNEEGGSRAYAWNLRLRSEFFEKLQESTGPGDVIILCSRVSLSWMEIQKMGNTLQYELGPPASSADFGAITSQLECSGATEKYSERDEAIAIQNITDFMSHHPAALQAVTGLMANHRFTARRTYRFLHEMVFGFKQQPSSEAPLEERIRALVPPDIQDFSITPHCRISMDLQLAFNSASKDPMLITFLAIVGCYRQLLPPDLGEVEDIIKELAGLIQWEHEFRPPSLKLALSWLEIWGLIDLSATTGRGYIYLNPLIWYTLQYLFTKAFADVTIALAKYIGYASFVKFTMTRLSIGRLDTLGPVPANELEKASEIVSIAIALTHLTPTDTTHELLIEGLAHDSSIVSNMRIVRTFKVMLGPRVNPPHYSYFSAIFALESLSSRFGERNDLAQLEAIEGLCNLLAPNDTASFTSWVSLGLERSKALEKNNSSHPSWLYFDFAFRFLCNSTHLIQERRGLTREWNPGPLNADLVDLQSEPFAPIPRGNEYYTPYHLGRLAASIKTLLGANISRCPLVIINKLRSDIVRSCDILLDDNTTPGVLRKQSRKIRKFFSVEFESMPDMMQVYSLVLPVFSTSPTVLDLLRDLGTADLETQSTYDQIVEAIGKYEKGSDINTSGFLHLAGAMSAWNRDDLEGAMEHLRAAKRTVPDEDKIMTINLWYLYAKVYSKAVSTAPLGSREREQEKRKLCEAIAQIMRLIELNPELEVQVRDDPALLNLGRRLKMLFDDDG
ncbi:hypothetical protein FOYG_17485 [Fusarium oxysporum NRRL 32931]|uniref:CHAT domain-containing protein n=1 Tax=Fusarium oxysporum NRRL 32931 TaxID=660029 RepID=W9HEC9_FUSOX|nr:hypothetical protein FOYG_17485 [Fusarium oxysporum NRRL 32931]